MKIKTIIIILVFLPFKMMSQNDSLVDPAKRWFIGTEIGPNKIISFTNGEGATSLQLGLLAEYYFAKHWSISARMKYFKTGTTYAADSPYGRFDGAVIAIPFDLKWEYRIFKNFSGNFTLGFALNQEIKSNYNYPPGASTDFPSFYANLNSGLGFNYFFNKTTAVYIGYELFLLGNDKDKEDTFEFVPNSTNNLLVNIGIKCDIN